VQAKNKQVHTPHKICGFDIIPKNSSKCANDCFNVSMIRGVSYSILKIISQEYKVSNDTAHGLNIDFVITFKAPRLL
jgi:hypothetical protein